MADEFVAKGKRLNQAVFGMAPYTLRRTDVNEAVLRTKGLHKEPILDARLGDPTVFGLSTYKGFTQAVSESFKDPRAWRYDHACGLPELREILARGNVEFNRNGYWVQPDRVFIGPGISGVSRSLFTAMINHDNGDELAIPEWSYIIYFAEAALSRARVVNIRLKDDGQVDIGHLDHSISERTKAVFLITVGNPLGIAMQEEVFFEIVKIINRKEREFDHPIYLVADTIYEGFRDGEPLDPILLSSKAERIGPTIELHSISKMISAPGARLGWIRVFHQGNDFKDEVDAFVEALARLFQPGLGSVPTAFQMALHKVYLGLAKPDEREAFDAFRKERRTNAIWRVRSLMESLSKFDGVVFPRYCYNEDGTINRNAINSFYLLVGIDQRIRPRNSEMSMARELAEFSIDQNNSPIMLTTPGDSFLASELRNCGQEYFRVVSLFDHHEMALAAEVIRKFTESKKR